MKKLMSIFAAMAATGLFQPVQSQLIGENPNRAPDPRANCNELCQKLRAGKAAGRATKDDITLYESHGMGIQDIYTAVKLVELARARKVGTELPM